MHYVILRYGLSYSTAWLNFVRGPSFSFSWLQESKHLPGYTPMKCGASSFMVTESLIHIAISLPKLHQTAINEKCDLVMIWSGVWLTHCCIARCWMTAVRWLRPDRRTLCRVVAASDLGVYSYGSTPVCDTTELRSTAAANVAVTYMSCNVFRAADTVLLAWWLPFGC